MARIPRVTQSIFAASATNNGVFGSAQDGTKILSNNLATLMAKPAWLTGWLDAVLGASKFPPLEEFQALGYITFTQLAYLLQQGVAEYDAGTTYYTNNIVVKAGTYQLYGSVTNGNIGNALTDAANWLPLTDLSAPGSAGAVAGTIRNLVGTRASATTATFAADEIVVESALGGSPAKLSSFNHTLDIATTGVNGMDTGSAPTNGYIYIYAITGPGQTPGLLGTTAGSASTIYSGAHMPASYTQSALIAILPTDGSAHFPNFITRDRELFYQTPVSILSGVTGVASFTSQSIAAAIPIGAKSCSGYFQCDTSGTVPVTPIIASDSSGTAQQQGSSTIGGTVLDFLHGFTFRWLPLITAQTIWWKNNGNSASTYITINSYTF